MRTPTPQRTPIALLALMALLSTGCPTEPAATPQTPVDQPPSEADADTDADTDADADADADADTDSDADADADADTDPAGPTCEDAQVVMDASCTVCHGGASPQGDLDLTDISLAVDLPSQQAPMDLVEPGQPSASYLLLKMYGTHAAVGSGTAMPPPGLPAPSAAQLAEVEGWVVAGALCDADTDTDTDADTDADTDTDADADADSDTDADTDADTDTGVLGETGDTEPPVDCDLLDIFARNGCVACHDATPGITGGGLDLLSPDVEDRLVGQPSNASSCSNADLVDATDPEASVLLRTLDPVSYPGPIDSTCSPPFMPLGSTTSIPAADIQCLADWAWTQENPDPPVVAPFDPVDVQTALTKAKVLLHGAAVTDSEIAVATAPDGSLDVDAMRQLIDGWVWAPNDTLTPQFNRKLRMFLELALQQTGTGGSVAFKFQSQLWLRPKNGLEFVDREALARNIEPMFVDMSRDIVEEQRDFRDVVTTRRWRVTTASLAALVYADEELTWPGNGNPPPENRFVAFEHLTPDDYSDWRYVNFAQADATTPADLAYENTAAFAESVRSVADGDTINLWAPRVGFFNTIQFLDEWETNGDNDFRIITSQTLAVALDAIFEAGDTTPPASLTGLDEVHASQTTACYSCHSHLDPMRSTFSAYYDLTGQAFGIPRPIEPSTFAFHGYVVPETNTMDDFAQTLVDHPRFATAWTQKLCMWANSQRCDEGDPEFQRIVDTFRDGYTSSADDDFRLHTLIRELFSSTLVTGATPSLQHDNTEFIVSSTRYGHFCGAINTRLEQAAAMRCDDEGADPSTCLAPQQDCFGGFGDGQALGVDSYTRGSADFVLPTSPDPMYSIAVREACRDVANEAVGNDNAFPKNADIYDTARRMTETILGMPPSDPKHDIAIEQLVRTHQILRNGDECAPSETPGTANDGIPMDGDFVCGHGLNANHAMQQLFVIACSSPSMTSIGF